MSRRRRWASRDTWMALFWLAAGVGLAAWTDVEELFR